MPKLTEYQEAQSFDENDILIKDGTNGTKKIKIEKVLEYMVDPTLATPGKAADAKNVGDKFNELKKGSVYKGYAPFDYSTESIDGAMRLHSILRHGCAPVHTILAYAYDETGNRIRFFLHGQNLMHFYNKYANTATIEIKAIYALDTEEDIELLYDTAPNIGKTPGYPSLNAESYEFYFGKNNFGTNNTKIVIRFVTSYYDQDNNVIDRVYSQQISAELVDGELIVTKQDFPILNDCEYIYDVFIGRDSHFYSLLIDGNHDGAYPANIYQITHYTDIPISESYAHEFRIYMCGTLSKQRVYYDISPSIDPFLMNTIYDKCEPGTCYSSNDGLMYNSNDHENHRTRYIYKIGNNSVIKVSTKPEDNVSTILINQYDSNFDYISTLSLTPTNNQVITTTSEDTEYIKVICANENDVYNFHGIEIASSGKIEKYYNPNKGEVEPFNSIPFNYVVSGNVMSSGRLLLPPNYSINGNKVPLVVYVHGSNAMLEWDSPMQTSYIDYLRYLANEGYAVFDCYPWTDKHILANPAYSPLLISNHKRAYIEGIKYVCSRFNVDINSVTMLCKSQGGHIGEWAITQTEFPFKAVALFAPSEDICPANGQFFYNANTRSALMQYIDFEGTAEEKEAFVTYGVMSNATVASFINKNKTKITALLPWAQGVSGVQSVDDLFDDTITLITQTPSWMTSLGLPEKPSGAVAINAFAQHSNYSKNAKCPVKFWCAFDDANTSSYSNYAIFTWLVNGGSDAEFRELPLNTGGHHAMDTDPNALKSSGTTALGIAYVDIPTAYVEAADFFRRNLAM